MLTREYSPDCTLGLLDVAGRKFFTIERPWTAHPCGRAGLDHTSCVPEGEYRVIPYMRPSGEKSFALSNPQLDVYQGPFDIPRDRRGIARAAIFIHAADHVHDVLGGIGPGLARERAPAGHFVLRSSRDAMNQIRTLVAHKFDLTLIIARQSQTAAA